MADLFSVGAGLTGVISLGLTACQGLIKYYESARSQAADVEKAVKQAEDLRSTLEILEKVIKTPQCGATNVVVHVESKIKSCEEGIRSLSTYLDKCKQEEPMGDWKEKLQAQKGRLLYPFRREALKNLVQTLHDVQQGLSTALDILNA